MDVKGLLYWRRIVPACCIAMFLCADRGRLIRMDSVSALICMLEIFSDTEDPFAPVLLPASS